MPSVTSCRSEPNSETTAVSERVALARVMAALAAQLNGKSLNQWSEEALMAAAQAAVEP